MYRCIDMREEVAQYQRIFWRDEEGLIKEYFLTTVTFGTASAPFTAIRVIHQIACDERERYPLAEHVIKKEIYVDDVQTGHETIDEALKIRNDVALRTIATLMTPSPPGMTSWMHPSCHLKGGTLSSFSKTMRPTLMLDVSTRHLLLS